LWQGLSGAIPKKWRSVRWKLFGGSSTKAATTPSPSRTAEFLELRRIINQHDPVGLIACHCPEDEYDPEVETILPRLETAKTWEDVHTVVTTEFLHWFGELDDPQTYRAMAQHIHEWLTYHRVPGREWRVH